MTKPSKPAAPPKSKPSTTPSKNSSLAVPPSPSEEDAFEIDAMDLEEWERDQRTPQAPDARLSELVKQSTVAEDPRPSTPSLVRGLAKHQHSPPPATGVPNAPTVRSPAPTASIIARDKPRTPVAGAAVVRRDATPPPAVPRDDNPFDSPTVVSRVPNGPVLQKRTTVSTRATLPSGTATPPGGTPTPPAGTSARAQPSPAGAPAVRTQAPPANAPSTGANRPPMAAVSATRTSTSPAGTTPLGGTPTPPMGSSFPPKRAPMAPVSGTRDAQSSARMQTPAGGVSAAERPTATPVPATPSMPKRAATPPAGAPARTPTRAVTPRAGIVPPREIEDSEGWALPDDAEDTDWSTVTATTPAPGAVREPVAPSVVAAPVTATTARAPAATPPAPTQVVVPAAPPSVVSVLAPAPVVAPASAFAPEPSVVDERVSAFARKSVSTPPEPQPLPAPPSLSLPAPSIAMTPGPPVVPLAPPPPALPYPVEPRPAPAPAHHEGFRLPREESSNQIDSRPVVRASMAGRTKAIIGGGIALALIAIIYVATRGSNDRKPETSVIANQDPPSTPRAREAPNGDNTTAGSSTATPPDPTSSAADRPAISQPDVTRTVPTRPPPTGIPPSGTDPSDIRPTGGLPTGTNPTGTNPTGTNPTGSKAPKGPKGSKTIGNTAPDPETGVAAVSSAKAENLAKARTAYEAGNTKLFSGDYDGAVTEYKQVVSLGSATGYRGLGLAYAQRGDKAKAAQAFRSYLGAAPNAKDADAIRKRIAALSAP